jgi:[ribosomal protein S5]-alanine N-acetyltransferase
VKRFLVGKRICLHGLALSDIEPGSPYYGWLDDLSLDFFGARSLFPNNSERMRAYYDAACANNKLVLLGVFENESGKHIGNVTLQDIDWIHRRAYLGYMIGERAFAGRGFATEACLMASYYGFSKLNFDRIWNTVDVENVASIRVAEKAGLQLEGHLRGHQLRKGMRYDWALFGALRDEWLPNFGPVALDLFAEPPV